MSAPSSQSESRQRPRGRSRLLEARTKVDVVISGDHRRVNQSIELRNIFSAFEGVCHVRLMFERNPGRAFNDGVRQTDTPFVVFAAGDMNTDEGNFDRLLASAKSGRIAYAPNPEDVRGDPTPLGFCSGFFVADRSVVLQNPFAEWPDGVEEIPYRAFLSDRIDVAQEIVWTHTQGSVPHLGSQLVRRNYARYCFRVRKPASRLLGTAASRIAYAASERLRRLGLQAIATRRPRAERS